MTTPTKHKTEPACAAPTRSGGVLILLMLLFTLPVATATLLYLSGWRPATGGNHGELIQPARPIENLGLQTLDGQPAHVSEADGNGSMV
ncbi:MAG: hypothetical protein ACM3JK_04260, partial [Betaproteobacteria bacterium]